MYARVRSFMRKVLGRRSITTLTSSRASIMRVKSVRKMSRRFTTLALIVASAVLLGATGAWPRVCAHWRRSSFQTAVVARHLCRNPAELSGNGFKFSGSKIISLSRCTLELPPRLPQEALR